MNTSMNWIKEYVPDLDCTPKEWTDAMTLTGTKVETCTILNKNLDKIVTGQIKSIEPIRMRRSSSSARSMSVRPSLSRSSPVRRI